MQGDGSVLKGLEVDELNIHGALCLGKEDQSLVGAFLTRQESVDDGINLIDFNHRGLLLYCKFVSTCIELAGEAVHDPLRGAQYPLDLSFVRRQRIRGEIAGNVPSSHHLTRLLQSRQLLSREPCHILLELPILCRRPTWRSSKKQPTGSKTEIAK